MEMVEGSMALFHQSSYTSYKKSVDIGSSLGVAGLDWSSGTLGGYINLSNTSQDPVSCALTCHHVLRPTRLEDFANFKALVDAVNKHRSATVDKTRANIRKWDKGWALWNWNLGEKDNQGTVEEPRVIEVSDNDEPKSQIIKKGRTMDQDQKSEPHLKKSKKEDQPELPPFHGKTIIDQTRQIAFIPDNAHPAGQQLIDFGAARRHEQHLEDQIRATGTDPQHVPWIRNGGFVDIEGHITRVWLQVKVEAEGGRR